MKQNRVEWITCIIFIIVGGILLFVSVLAIKSSMNFKNNALEGKATIYDIKKHIDDEGNAKHTVYVKYSIDNIEYNEVLNYYNTSMKYGDEIKIYYDPNLPTQIQAKGELTFLFIVPAMGLIFFLIGIIFAINKIKKSTSKNKLMKNGIELEAVIEEVILNTSYKVNRVNPYVINCRVTDITNDETVYLVKSENIWFDPKTTIEQNSITSFPIYIDKKNKKKYYICIDKLKQKTTDLR